MPRSTRLFEIIQILRSATQPMTAEALAKALEVSMRTVYRDIAALQAMRTPIEGEAGIGYVMRKGYDLPPLNFDQEEAEVETVRTVRPLALVYHLECVVLAGWCELRAGFRHFRTDRIWGCEELDERFEGQSKALREVLRDMIIDFAQRQKDCGADVMLDLWPDMPHDFQAYDGLTASSTEALQRIRQALKTNTGDGPPLAPLPEITIV